MLAEHTIAMPEAKLPEGGAPSGGNPGNKIGILWAQFGPYHFARAAALQKLVAPATVRALELANQSVDYAWTRSAEAAGLITLCPGAMAERLSFWQVFRSSRRTFAELKLDVCILPGYAPKQSLAALLAAKSLGIRTVMMNESHAGTARARGIGAWAKRRLVRLFDAALVGGSPQKRYFASLGLPEEKIFAGYDSVDNDYFAARAEEIRDRKSEIRSRYELPEHYFLSLGRFIAKKNLATLIRAYRNLLDASPDCQTHLVMVGSGEEETTLRRLCSELKLPVCDHAPGPLKSAPSPEPRASRCAPSVHFYGFRQIEENPVFYALADAFILPSLWEEWGLVVNEAMASGLPVVVSETAGCVEDLLEPGQPAGAKDWISRSPELSGRVRKNGFVFDPESPESLAAMLLIFAAAPALVETMGRNSWEIVEKCSCDNFARNALLAAEAAAVPRTGRRQQ
jgi:glycosyltransferase involved in cell wall biosynthesis